MAIPMTPFLRARPHRPATVWTFAAVLLFLGVSAVAGGIAMLSGFTPPDRWLDEIPLVGTWLIPGLVLALGFGAGSLVTAYGVIRRPSWAWLSGVERRTGHHWCWAAGLTLGLGQAMWIALELAYLPQRSALQVVYGATGVLLVLLPLLPPVRHHLTHPRAGSDADTRSVRRCRDDACSAPISDRRGTLTAIPVAGTSSSIGAGEPMRVGQR
jgi:hypothetical protein